MEKTRKDDSVRGSLWQLRRGESCVINGFDEAMQQRFKVRLTELGFRPGASVSCTVAPRLGAPKLYRVANAVYSLEKQIAEMVSTKSQFT
ncbi:MAG: ferrous iron transport protein A [Proteobacteria bacterium]|nr:ferrous iron transport protein A [Pseudomonadota bacterium]